MTQEIFLFRHGKTEANEKQLYCGKTDIPLSENGIGELKKKISDMKTLEKSYPDISKCKVFASPKKRVTQSLSLLYPELLAKAELSEDFCELDFGDFEMKSYSELKTDSKYQTWIQNEMNRFQNDNKVSAENPCPSGESYFHMQKRVISALEKALSTYRSFAVFTHGGVIAIIMDYFFPDEKKTLYDWQSKFGEGWKITIKTADNTKIYKKIP